MMYIPRLRRINDVLKEMKQKDPNTAMTFCLIMEIIKSGAITAMKYGNSWLINIDELYAYLKGAKF